MPSEEPVKFEHFEVARRADGALHELGRGAMGVTYKAFDTRLGSHVALKVIHADSIKSDVGRIRFEREAKAAAHLNHPNVAAIFHRGQEGGAYFYAMQFIDGETFDAFVRRRGPLSAVLALRLILQAAQGLSAASTRGLIHRDIKPANLMLVHADGPAEADIDDEDLLVKVIDFGLAKYLHKADDTTTDASLTGDRIVGTPYYISPEQIDPQGREIDARADIYSLGVTLWHLLCGNPPFRGTEFQVLNQHIHNSLPWEQLPASVPASVHDLLERMMAKNPADRPANHRELIGLIKQQLRTLDGGSSGAMGGTTPNAAGPGQTPLQDVVEQVSGASLLPADFSLADVLRRRGNLTTSEVLGLLSLLAPVVDAKRDQEGQAYDLQPARIFVRFDTPPADPAALPAQRLDTWPPSQLEIAPVGVDSDLTTLAGSGHPAQCLGALAYELLSGHPAATLYQPVASVNARGNAMLRQVLEAQDAFGTAVKFADAFRLALAGELHVPDPPPVSGPGSTSRGSDTRSDVMIGYPRTSIQQRRRRLPMGGGTIFVALCVLAAAGWWWLSKTRKLPAMGPLASLNGYLQPIPVPPVKPVPTPVVSPTVLGSITSTAVRRYAPPPFFPPAAKAAKQQGKVVLDVAVDSTGNVTGATVKQSSGFQLLDDSATQTLRAWKFDPARTNGTAVASRLEQSIEFHPPPPGPPMEPRTTP